MQNLFSRNFCLYIFKRKLVKKKWRKKDKKIVKKWRIKWQKIKNKAWKKIRKNKSNKRQKKFRFHDIFVYFEYFSSKKYRRKKKLEKLPSRRTLTRFTIFFGKEIVKPQSLSHPNNIEVKKNYYFLFTSLYDM